MCCLSCNSYNEIGGNSEGSVPKRPGHGMARHVLSHAVRTDMVDGSVALLVIAC